MTKTIESFSNVMLKIGENARHAARILTLASSDQKNSALKNMAHAILQAEETILQANAKDILQAQQKNHPAAFIDRLTLTALRVKTIANSLLTIVDLPDPVGKTLAEIKRPNGLLITKMSVPIGVIGVIYESRPNVTADAAALCLKAGNAVILRGGSESFNSSLAILTAIQSALADSSLPQNAVQMLPTADRNFVSQMLKMDNYIDVIIPRGGQQLINTIAAASRIPLFKHLAGLCHTYVHRAANKEMACKILVNAKMRRPGICGATETLLIDRDIVDSHLPDILHALLQAGCEIRGESAVVKLNSAVKLASDTDFDTEFLDAIIAVKIVDNIDAAIKHIALHGTQHTDAIITEDKSAAQKFFSQIDSAIVMHNTSTQFADGGEFGMGAEIGIATGKLHARGPVGLEQLTTFKYLVSGTGQVRS